MPGLVLAKLYHKSVVQGEGKAVENGWVPPPAASQQAPVTAPEPVVAKTTAPAPEQPVELAPPPVKQAPVQPMAVPERPVEAVEKAAMDPLATLAAEAPKPATAGAYKFLGNNRQQVAIIVRFAGEAFLPEQHLQMLTKMLGACKLNLGDVAIVNDAVQRVELPLLKDQLQPKRVLLFGVTPDEAGLPLAFPAFKDQEYAGTTYLHTPSLEILNQETEEGKLLKRKLWDCLKKIFNV